MESLVLAGVRRSPSGEEYFGRVNTFVSYTWRGDRVTFAGLAEAVLGHPAGRKRERGGGSEPMAPSPGCAPAGVGGDPFFFIDILVCAQNRCGP